MRHAVLAVVLAVAGAAATTTSAAGASHVASARTSSHVAWTVQAVPSPRGAAANAFNGVACPTTTRCVAVGVATTPRAYPVLAEIWEGRAWAVQSIPTPPGSGSNSLQGVACPLPTRCVAVGYRTVGPGYTVALVETWDGRTWSITGSPTHVGARFSSLAGIACASATSCEAVGSYETTSGATYALAEGYDGHRWVLDGVAQPRGAAIPSIALSGVECLTATSCAAVGRYADAAHVTRTLVERWQGGHFVLARSSNPRGAPSSELRGVACRSATSCVAVGQYSAGRIFRALAERLVGGSWIVQPTPARPGARSMELDAVTCASGTCVAAGSFATTPTNGFSVIERWSGGGWAIEPAPTPRGAAVSLSGVACRSPVACEAVGASAVDETSRPLALRG